MNNKKLKELEELAIHLDRNTVYDGEGLFNLIKYVRQLKKEAKEDECPYCEIMHQQGKDIQLLLDRLEPLLKIEHFNGAYTGKSISDETLKAVTDGIQAVAELREKYPKQSKPKEE